jgi:DMSO reductase anchor subunit
LVIGHFAPTISIVAFLLAASGVFCSAMIYTDTRRYFWRFSQTSGRMAGTVLVAACAFVHPPLAAGVLIAKLALELSTSRGHSSSARLQQGPLHRQWGSRVIVGLLTLLLFFANHSVMGFLLFTIGELLERTLFFRAVDSPKMPGVPSV